jgi:hypothetical protein
MKTEIQANSEKFEVLRGNTWSSYEEMKSRVGALVSRVDVHQASSETTNWVMNQEKMVLATDPEARVRFQALPEKNK